MASWGIVTSPEKALHEWEASTNTLIRTITRKYFTVLMVEKPDRDKGDIPKLRLIGIGNQLAQPHFGYYLVAALSILLNHEQAHAAFGTPSELQLHPA